MSKKNFALAEQKNAILITQVKNNQKNLRKKIIRATDALKPHTVIEETIAKHHGRIERRTYKLWSAEKIFARSVDWKPIKCIIKVTRKIMRIDRNKETKTTIEHSYYVANKILPPTEIFDAIRRHWHIENNLNYVKDTAFIEDKCKRRCNPGVFSICIDYALNILRKNNFTNIRGKILVSICNCNHSYKFIPNRTNSAIKNTPMILDFILAEAEACIGNGRIILMNKQG